jgi:hypothetical protein
MKIHSSAAMRATPALIHALRMWWAPEVTTILPVPGLEMGMWADVRRVTKAWEEVARTRVEMRDTFVWVSG